MLRGHFLTRLIVNRLPLKLSSNCLNFCRYNSTMTDPDLSRLDQTQLDLLAEQCILINTEDKVLGHETKKQCHLNTNIDSGLLHRAFSVFLFNSNGQLLLQQRSSAKITFPEYFTNTCCSHPLYRQEELEDDQQLGVKRAAQRKLGHELGIPSEQVPPNCFTFLTRILYKARSCDVWGEHEIDYILFTQRDVTLLVNPNEVMSVRYVTQEELRQLLEEGRNGKVKITPWFQLICDTFLFKWWDQLSSLSSVTDCITIHNMI